MFRGGAEDDIVASGQALKVAASWLGIEDPAAALEEEGGTLDLSQPRPQGLGLGAKYLPHHKGVLLTAGVQQRLGNKLKQSKDRFHQQAAEPSGSRGLHQQKRHRLQQPPEARTTPVREAEGNSDGGSSDEDEGRGAAFGKRQAGGDQEALEQQQQRRQRPKLGQQQPLRFTKQDLLMSSGSGSGASGKPKRKGKKRQLGAAT
ncbi:hypothetical protein N2152v2_009585 [Parachlorella kessleri]